MTHAQWASPEACVLEDLLVALADKLWKGARVSDLEQRVVSEVASRVGVDPWSVFVPFDACFESIADASGERLLRSR